MNMPHPLQERRQAAIDEQIREATSVAAVGVLEKVSAGESEPYRVNLPAEPRGITTREYVERVQENVITMLGATGLTETLEYDGYHSDLVNARALRHRQQNLFTRHFHQGVSLVFRELRPVEH